MMKKLADRKFPWEVKRDVYIIEKKREDGSIPRILIKKTEAGSEVLFDMLDDTESYRVNKMVNLLPSVSEGKEIRQIVVYLLKSWDALTTEQCAVVLNAANNLIGSSEYDADIKAKMALDLRAFIIASNKNKKQNELVSTFEQLRDVDGKIEVEIPV